VTKTEEHYVILGNGECILYQGTVIHSLSAKRQLYSLFLSEFST